MCCPPGISRELMLARGRGSASHTPAARQHAAEHVVVVHEVVLQCRQHVQTGEYEERIGQHLVQLLESAFFLLAVAARLLRRGACRYRGIRLAGRHSHPRGLRPGGNGCNPEERDRGPLGRGSQPAGYWKRKQERIERYVGTAGKYPKEPARRPRERGRPAEEEPSDPRCSENEHEHPERAVPVEDRAARLVGFDLERVAHHEEHDDQCNRRPVQPLADRTVSGRIVRESHGRLLDATDRKLTSWGARPSIRIRRNDRQREKGYLGRHSFGGCSGALSADTLRLRRRTRRWAPHWNRA